MSGESKTRGISTHAVHALKQTLGHAAGNEVVNLLSKVSRLVADCEDHRAKQPLPEPASGKTVGSEPTQEPSSAQTEAPSDPVQRHATDTAPPPALAPAAPPPPPPPGP